MRKFVIALSLLVAIAVALIIFARGPEGAAIAKDSQELVQGASDQSGLVLVEVVSPYPRQVPLPWHTALKHQLKRLTASIGVTVRESEYTIEYLVGSDDGKTKIQCLMLQQGDHVIGISLRPVSGDSTAVSRFQDALNKQFPDYQILILNHNDT